jgi:hypothetical protein
MFAKKKIKHFTAFTKVADGSKFSESASPEHPAPPGVVQCTMRKWQQRSQAMFSGNGRHCRMHVTTPSASSMYHGYE